MTMEYTQLFQRVTGVAISLCVWQLWRCLKRRNGNCYYLIVNVNLTLHSTKKRKWNKTIFVVYLTIPSLVCKKFYMKSFYYIIFSTRKIHLVSNFCSWYHGPLLISLNNVIYGSNRPVLLKRRLKTYM